jgi:hypothetical protein
MIKKTVVVLALLVLAFAIGACGSVGNGSGVSSSSSSVGSGFAGYSTESSTTPEGYPCTELVLSSSGTYDIGCYYFISNGTAVACQTNANSADLCPSMNGNYYNYDYGDTFICKNAECTNTAIVAAPTAVAGPNCSAKIVYGNLIDDGQAWEVVNQLEDQNTTQAQITATFTSTSATTVSTSASIDISASADASLLDIIFVSVRAQINASVTKTASTVVGDEVRVPIPPGKTLHGIYGVSVQVTTGHLYQSNNCNGQPNYGTVKTYVPITSGWCVWISGETPCRVVSGN